MILRYVSAVCMALVTYFATLGLMLAIDGLLPAIPAPIFMTALIAGVVGFIVRSVT
jgi:hypothetical protein